MIGTNGIKKEHLVGVAVGLGVAALGIYLYKKNQNKVDAFLREQGINTRTNSNNFSEMDLVSLTEMKEHIEDLIAEKSEEVEEIK